MQTQKDERSLGDLFGDLTREMGTLMRQEVHLATTEVSANAKEAGKQIAMLVVGGLVAYAGLLVLLAAATLALATQLPDWAAALIVGLIVVAIGALLVQRGRSALAEVNLAPKKTLETIKEDAQWAKEQVS